METNTNTYIEDEREIDLVDVFGRLISKWRSICVVILISILVAVGIGCAMASVAMKEADIERQKVSASKAVSLALTNLLKEETGEDQQLVADSNVEKYIKVQSLYEMQKEDNEKSIYYNLDATNISKATLDYYIDNHFVNEYPVVNGYNNIEDIIGAYENLLVSDNVCNDISSIIGKEIEPKYIRELIKTSNSSTSNLSIEIHTDNKDMTQAIMDYYKEAMTVITADIVANYGDVSFTLQSEQMQTQSDMVVLDAQNAANNKILDYFDQLSKIKKSMSGAQLQYFEAMIAKAGLERLDVEKEEHSFFYFLPKKIMVLIVMAAFVVIVMIHGMAYLLDGTIKTADEIASMAHATNLGTVLVDNDKKRKNILFDKWAVALTDARVMCEDSDKMVSTISTSVVKFVEANALKNVLIVGNDIKHTGIVDTIKNSISEAKVNAEVAIDAIDNPESVTKLSEADVVLFVGEVGNSKYKKLERVLSMCKLYKKSVMGSIAIQERI